MKKVGFGDFRDIPPRPGLRKRGRDKNIKVRRYG